MAECVFCTRREQPAILFDTPSLYAMPDKYPMRPGHVLVIAKEHLRCYGAAPIGVLAELDEAATRVRRFLDDVYGTPVATFENGIAGQSVFHAHLHLVPGLVAEIPAEVVGHADVVAVDGWQQVAEHLARHGSYRYVAMDGHRYVIPGHSPVLGAVRRAMAEHTGMVLGEHGWERTTTPEDVLEVNRRWGDWTSRGTILGSVCRHVSETG